jgi:phage shock protein PspC (stress-responsive transcriptional regulator)
MSEHTTHTQSLKSIRRLERPADDRMIAGVASGLGRYFDLTPAVFRLGFVVLTLLGGAGILIYVAAVLVMPKEGEDASIAERALAERRQHPGRLVGLGLLALAILAVLSQTSTWPSAGAAWFIALVGLVVLVASGEGRARRLAIAALSIIAVLVVAAAVAIASAFAWFDVSLGDGVGDRSYAPTTVAGVHPKYKLGIGKLQVDLSSLRRPVDVKTSVGIGELRVIVPQDVPVAIDAKVKAGSISALGREDDGKDARVVSGAGGIHVTARVGAGHITIVRAG